MKKHKHRWIKVGGTFSMIEGKVVRIRKRCLDCGELKEVIEHE